MCQACLFFQVSDWMLDVDIVVIFCYCDEDDGDIDSDEHVCGVGMCMLPP